METRIQTLVNEKLASWNRQAMVNAKRAQLNNVNAVLVTYPTGTKYMRFAEPFKEYGMFYEVIPEVWDYLKNGGVIIS